MKSEDRLKELKFLLEEATKVAIETEEIEEFNFASSKQGDVIISIFKDKNIYFADASIKYGNKKIIIASEEANNRFGAVIGIVGKVLHIEAPKSFYELKMLIEEQEKIVQKEIAEFNEFCECYY